MALIGLNQQTAFADPQNGQSPMDADAVRNNDNALVAKHNAHDADATVHVQTGLLASRPAASTPYAMYMDENGIVYRDTGATWTSIGYVRLTGGTTQTIAGNVIVGSNLAVDGLTDLNGNTDITGNLVVSGSVTAASIVGPTTVAASNVTNGTFGSGAYVFPNAATVNGAFVANAGVGTNALTVTNGSITGHRDAQDATGAVALDLSLIPGNYRRLRLTGNTTFTVSGGVVGREYTIELLQDGTGSRTVSWSGVTWPAGTAPTQTSTANRKDLYKFYYDSSAHLGYRLAADFASTG